MLENFSREIEETISLLLGKKAEDLQFWQTMLRAFIIYVIALLFVRLGKKRLFGQNSAFDVILGIMLGSIFSRAINGNAPFFGTLTSCLILIGLHAFFSIIAFRSHGFGHLIKGDANVLVKDGEIQWDTMKKNDITEEDLIESLRMTASTDKLDTIRLATLERNAKISFVQKEKSPKIIEIEVREGVQKVRIEIS